MAIDAKDLIVKGRSIENGLTYVLPACGVDGFIGRCPIVLEAENEG